MSSSEKDASSKSEPSSLNPGLNYGAGAADTTGENVSGNASPIPFDDFGNPHMDDNLSLPHEFSSRMSTSLPIVSLMTCCICTCIFCMIGSETLHTWIVRIVAHVHVFLCTCVCMSLLDCYECTLYILYQGRDVSNI